MNEKKQSVRDAYAKFKENPELNGDALLKAVNTYRDEWLNERKKTQDTQWRQNTAFYAGDQYCRIPSPRPGTYRVRLRENHTNNIISRTLSIVSQNMPIPRVFPNSTDAEDQQNSDTTEAWIKYNWRIKRIEELQLKCLKYALIFGSGFRYRAWDPTRGGRIRLNAGQTESGEEETKLYRGDIALSVDDPFKLVFRPGIDELSDMWDFLPLRARQPRDARSQVWADRGGVRRRLQRVLG
jgi:hypothetical protein